MTQTHAYIYINHTLKEKLLAHHGDIAYLHQQQRRNAHRGDVDSNQSTPIIVVVVTSRRPLSLCLHGV